MKNAYLTIVMLALLPPAAFFAVGTPAKAQNAQTVTVSSDQIVFLEESNVLSRPPLIPRH